MNNHLKKYLDYQRSLPLITFKKTFEDLENNTCYEIGKRQEIEADHIGNQSLVSIFIVSLKQLNLKIDAYQRYTS